MRTYNKNESIVFCKTRADFGELSNMHFDFPLVVNNLSLSSSEALYQIFRFTEHPEIQEEILNAKRPMASKFIAIEHIEKSRPDFDEIKIDVMRWVLKTKVCQYYEQLKNIISLTKYQPIIEYSKKDTFWGATKTDSFDTLVGNNILGRLWEEQRELIYTQPSIFFEKNPPPNFSKALILNQPISTWAK